MGFTSRKAFDGGWQPNADPLNAPPNALLRADNLMYDERDVPSLRPGSTTISSGLGGDVHSLYTTYINGAKVRMAGVGNALFANGASVFSPYAGSDDIFFGFQLGQILTARSTTKKKYDGATVRNWGIAMNGQKPVATGVAPDSKTLATGAESQATNPNDYWYKLEAGGFAAVTDFEPNHYLTTDPLYNAVGAVKLEMATSKRAVYERHFAGIQDFSVYQFGTLGDDEDYVSLYLWLSDPRQVVSFNLQVTVNGLNWDKDWFNSPTWTADPLSNDGPHRISPTPGQTLPALPSGTVTATDTGTAVPRPPGSTPQPTPALTHKGLGAFRNAIRPGVGGQGTGEGNFPYAGWTKIQWRRGDFVRSGSTQDKGWNSVEAIRLVIVSKTQDLIARADTIKMFGGAITGSARWRYVYVRNDGKYLAKSAMSPASTAITLDHQAASVTIPSDGSRDSQVNEIWVYRFDEQMDTYYRVFVKTGVSGTGSYLITDQVKTRDALEANIVIELDNVVPPDNIIGIAGPHYDRTFVLTANGQVWPSRKLDPDAFSNGQAIQVCGQDETPFWIYQATTELFIGTSKDIYRIEGTGAENPDGSIDFAVRQLSMDHKPISEAVAHEGNQIVYMSDDGWRGFDGSGGSTLITQATGLLYRGQDRAGVSAINLSSGRFRAVLGRGKFIAITPEGASTTSSAILYRYEFHTGRWFRHPYSPSWRSIIRERDGTVLVGTSGGAVVQLDTTVTNGDDGAAIPVVLWTTVDPLDMPYQRKKAGSFWWRSNSAGAAENIAIHLNGSSAPTITLVATNNGVAAATLFDVGNDFLADNTTPNPNLLPAFRQVEHKVTGQFFDYRLYDYAYQFRERPVPMIARVPMKLAGGPGIKRISGFQLTCCTLGVERIFTAILDGVRDPETFALTTSLEEPETHKLHFTLNARQATDIQLSVDGELEMDAWSAIITHDEPVGVKVWDSGPILDNPREYSWLKALNFKVRAGADLVVTPYFDGRAFPTVTIAVDPGAETVYRIQVGRSYVGKQPRIKVKSCEEFFPYWVQPERRDSGSPTQKSRPRQGMKVQTR